MPAPSRQPNDGNAQGLRLANGGAEAFGLGSMKKRVGGADPGKRLRPSQSPDEFRIDSTCACKSLEPWAFGTVADDDEDIEGPLVCHERDCAVHSLGRHEPPRTDCDSSAAEPGFDAADGVGHVRNFDGGCTNARDLLEVCAGPTVETSQQLTEQVVRNERPRGRASDETGCQEKPRNSWKAG